MDEGSRRLEEKHGAQFELTKNLLVHFTRSRNWNTDVKITINSVTISPSQVAKYLGVMFDQQLRYKSHVEYLTKKGAKFGPGTAEFLREAYKRQEYMKRRYLDGIGWKAFK
jgi:hypothetical protein